MNERAERASLEELLEKGDVDSARIVPSRISDRASLHVTMRDGSGWHFDVQGDEELGEVVEQLAASGVETLRYVPGARYRPTVGEVRGYFFDFFADEAVWTDYVPEDSPTWFADFAEYVKSRPLDDQRLVGACIYMEPLFIDEEEDPGFIGVRMDDGEVVPATMYPGGEANAFTEESQGGDFDSFLTGFVAALGTDHAAWLQGAFREPW